MFTSFIMLAIVCAYLISGGWLAFQCLKTGSRLAFKIFTVPLIVVFWPLFGVLPRSWIYFILFS